MAVTRFILLISFYLSLSGCVEKPPDLELPIEDLVGAIADAHVAEGALLSVRPLIKDSVRNAYYDQIFEIHGVDSLAFTRDMAIIKENPRIMEKIYELVTIELNKREKQLTDDAKQKNK